MLISAKGRKTVEELLEAELARINATDSGKPMSLAAMEDLVVAAGQRFQQQLMKEVVQENNVRVGTEKKSVPDVQPIPGPKDSDRER